MKALLFIIGILLTACPCLGTEPVKTDLLCTTPQYVRYGQSADAFCIANEGKATTICVAPEDWKGVIRAAHDLADDIHKVSDATPRFVQSNSRPHSSIVIYFSVERC